MYMNLKKELKKRKIPAIRIAEYLGCRSSTVYDKINGKYRFYYDEAKKIRDKFFPDVSIEYLFESSDSEADEAS